MISPEEWTGPETHGKGKRITGDVGVLLSGGIDSVTLLYKAEYEKRLRGAWHIDYGQPAAQQEGECSSRFICEWGLVGHRIVVPIAGHVALLHEGDGLRVVPARNLVMLSTVATWANAHSISELWYGATCDDESYPDCTREFVASLNAVLTPLMLLRVRAPWLELGWGKREVVAHARSLRVPFARTWSCYHPTDAGKQCGRCAACQRRSEALAQ